MKNAIYIEFDGINLGTEDSYANHARNILTLINKNITKSVDVGNIQNDDLWGDFGWFGTFIVHTKKINIFLAKYNVTSSWELTIEMANYPSFWKKLFKSHINMDYTEELKLISEKVFDCIKKELNPCKISIWSNLDYDKKADIAEIRWK